MKAIEGRETLAIAEALSRSLAFVERWVYAHRDRGIEAIAARKRGGDRSKIKGVMAARLEARLDAGPTPADMVCVLRGKDVQRIAKQELGADVSLTTVHRTPPRLGDSCLAPRPRREKQDLDAQPQFREVAAPPIVRSVSRRFVPAGGRTRLFCASRSWTKRGSGSKAR